MVEFDNVTSMVERVPVGGQVPSPPTLRVVRTIDVLSRRPDEHLSLAEIIRETGMSRATAHAVLSQLTMAGWTLRDADGNYALGTGFATVARRADAAFPLRRAAVEPMRTLSTGTGVPVFLAERDGATIAITEIVGEPSLHWIRLGRRLPLRPPVCREFVAWAPEDERGAWLDMAEPNTRERLAEVLDAVRARGYAVERLADESAPMLEMISSLRHSPITDAIRTRLGDVLADLITIDYLPHELGADNAVVSIAAPVFDIDGRVVASLVACPDNHLSAQEVASLGDAVAAAAHALGQ